MSGPNSARLAAPRKTDDAARLAALDRYDILDTPAEPGFDDIVHLAAQICETPVALVSLVAGDRQWFKARVGFDPCQTPIEQSVCAHALDQTGLLIVPDLTLDPRTRENPLVTGEPHIRFYAGARLETPEGEALGTLCVIDGKPRPEGLTPAQATGLERLARQVMSQMELRRAVGAHEQAVRRARQADTLHRQVLNSATDYAIITMDREGLVSGWNSGAEGILGWSEAEMCGKPADTFFTEEDAAAGVPRREMQAAREKGRGIDERWHRRKGGARFWGLGEMMPLTAEGGAHVGYLKILRDRTEQRRAEEVLREVQGLNARILENSRDCIVVLDLEGNNLFVSPGGIASMEVSDVEAILGLPWLRVWKGEDYEAACAAVAEAAAGRIGCFQGFCPTHKGTPKWWDVVISPLLDHHGRPERLVSIGRDITQRRKAEDQLRQLNATLEQQVEERTRALTASDARQRAVFDVTRQLMGVMDLDGTLLEINRAALAAIGARREDVVGRPFWAGPWFSRTAGMEEVVKSAVETARNGVTARTEVVLNLPDGGTRNYDFAINPVRDESGRIIEIMPEASDITELRRTEDALRQSQKMEAVGQLTGGLAHDFNNLLAGISGSLELMNTRLSQGRLKDVERYIAAAQGASRRAAALTHRLLAFSRRQTLAPKPTNVNRLVTGMEEMIRRTVGPAITIESVGAASAWPALVDPPQLENALLNLCINARDAMPNGGRITIETANKWVDVYSGRLHDLAPGQYLSLSVTDTGSGMTPEVIARAFEPFFTTKPIGEGTGLGLSMIYGFAQQSGGQVRIYSEVDVGTTVCLYLPRHYGETDEGAGGVTPEKAPRAEQGETVLVVDDEPTVRMLITDVLEDLGYTAIEAADSMAGLKVLQSNVRIDLLVTDVGLPGGMNGRQMADAGRVSRPGLKVLFITGYAENSVLGNGHLAPGMQVLTKPFAIEALAARIKEIIAAG